VCCANNRSNWSGFVAHKTVLQIHWYAQPCSAGAYNTHSTVLCTVHSDRAAPLHSVRVQNLNVQFDVQPAGSSRGHANLS
jgi:hypothetical protein